jgi:hypothetical protein
MSCALTLIEAIIIAMIAIKTLFILFSILEYVPSSLGASFAIANFIKLFCVCVRSRIIKSNAD